MEDGGWGGGTVERVSPRAESWTDIFQMSSRCCEILGSRTFSVLLIKAACDPKQIVFNPKVCFFSPGMKRVLFDSGTIMFVFSRISSSDGLKMWVTIPQCLQHKLLSNPESLKNIYRAGSGRVQLICLNLRLERKPNPANAHIHKHQWGVINHLLL